MDSDATFDIGVGRNVASKRVRGTGQAMLYSFLMDPGATFPPGLGEMWFKNGSVESGKPCCFTVLRLFFSRYQRSSMSTTSIRLPKLAFLY